MQVRGSGAWFVRAKNRACEDMNSVFVSYFGIRFVIGVFGVGEHLTGREDFWVGLEFGASVAGEMRYRGRGAWACGRADICREEWSYWARVCGYGVFLYISLIFVGEMGPWPYLAISYLCNSEVEV